MKIAVLHTSFKDYENKEVEEDLMEVGKLVRSALKLDGHDVSLHNVDDKTFNKLKKKNFDFAFNVCERFNGSSLLEPHVAAMLDMVNIPYTGSGPLALALCINKPKMKEILAHNKIPTPKFQIFESNEDKLRKDMKFPLIVKPIKLDNSIGIDDDSVVKDEKELKERVEYVKNKFSQDSLVEEFIIGREFAVGVMGNKNPIALPVAEINFHDKKDGYTIFSYDNKFSDDAKYGKVFKEEVPAKIPKKLSKKMQKLAIDAYKSLHIQDYGRIDIRLSKDGTPYILEMNPNPGLTWDNTLPRELKTLGLDNNDLINEVLHIALKRCNRESDSKIIKMAEKNGIYL